MTQTTYDPDGRAIPYASEGVGPALVLIPDVGKDIAALGTLAHVLAEEDFRVIRVGAGRAADDGDLSALAQEVIDVLDHLDVADAWIGGHAAGGAVARAVAVEHNDRVNGVLLLGVDEDAARGTVLAPHVPVLVIQGSDDDVTPPVNGERLRELAPDRVSVAAVDGAGHLFAATHPGETAAIIEDYLDWD